MGATLVAMHRLLIAAASHCRTWALGAWASVVEAQRLITCGSRALEHAGFSSRGTRPQQFRLSGSRAQAQ